MKDISYHDFQCIEETSGAWSSGKHLQVHSVGTFIVSLGVASSYKFGVAEPIKKAFADFFKKLFHERFLKIQERLVSFRVQSDLRM